MYYMDVERDERKITQLLIVLTHKWLRLFTSKDAHIVDEIYIESLYFLWINLQCTNPAKVFSVGKCYAFQNSKVIFKFT